MALQSEKEHKGKKNSSYRKWIIQVTISTFFISATISLLSNWAMQEISILWAFLLLLGIVSLGIITDIIGTAAASAERPPFLSMAARKVPGSEQGVWILNNAEKVSNFCNDVIGDICGIVSGATGAAIVTMLLVYQMPERWIGLAMSALTAAITVGGKAMGKRQAMHNSRNIVLFVGRAMSFLHITPKRR